MPFFSNHPSPFALARLTGCFSRWFSAFFAVMIMATTPLDARAAVPAPSLGAASPNGTPTVVVSILPLASLVAGVLGEEGTVVPLVPPGQSPHTFALKPSQARIIGKADALVWIGPGMEAFLPPLLPSLPPQALKIALAETPDLPLLPLRQGNDWAPHDHSGEGRHGKEHHEHDHDHDEKERELGNDFHLWLDPGIARIWIQSLAETFAQAYPEHADAYRRNAAATNLRLERLEAEMASALASIKERPFVLTHDVTQYLERRFGLHAIGAISPDPSIPAGARHIAALRKKVNEAGAVCLFAEPQLDQRLLKTISEGTQLRLGLLDPLGRETTATPDGYIQLMHALTRSLVDCLSPPQTQQ